MKLVCKCGNEMEFKHDEHSEETSKFAFWSEHDEITITCKNCNETIWLFT